MLSIIMKKTSRLLVRVSFIVLFFFVWVRFASAADATATISLAWISAWSFIAIILLPRKSLLPQISLAGWLILSCILIYGWFQVWNARSGYTPRELSFTKYPNRLWPDGPGSVTKEASQAKMLEISGLVLAFLALVRARESSIWLWLVAVIPIFGALTTLAGLFHRVIDAPSVWFVDASHPATFFAPFIYNSHAGAFLNLSGILACSFLFSTLGTDRRNTGVFWAVVSLICFGGVFSSASKGAFMLLPLSLFALFFCNRSRIMHFIPELMGRNERRSGIERKVTGLALVVLALTVTVIGSQYLTHRLTGSVEEVTETGRLGSLDGRLGMMKVMLNMAGPNEGSWSGFGPGSYEYIVPYFLAKPELSMPGRWVHGHSDPLQLVVEWGYMGAVLWGVFALGSLFFGLIQLRTKQVEPSSRPIIRGIMLGLIGLVIHSCFDFPFGIIFMQFLAMMLCACLWSKKAKEVDS